MTDVAAGSGCDPCNPQPPKIDITLKNEGGLTCETLQTAAPDECATSVLGKNSVGGCVLFPLSALQPHETVVNVADEAIPGFGVAAPLEAVEMRRWWDEGSGGGVIPGQFNTISAGLVNPLRFGLIAADPGSFIFVVVTYGADPARSPNLIGSNGFEAHVATVTPASDQIAVTTVSGVPSVAGGSQIGSHSVWRDGVDTVTQIVFGFEVLHKETAIISLLPVRAKQAGEVAPPPLPDDGIANAYNGTISAVQITVPSPDGAPLTRDSFAATPTILTAAAGTGTSRSKQSAPSPSTLASDCGAVYFAVGRQGQRSSVSRSFSPGSGDWSHPTNGIVTTASHLSTNQFVNADQVVTAAGVIPAGETTAFTYTNNNDSLPDSVPAGTTLASWMVIPVVSCDAAPPTVTTTETTTVGTGPVCAPSSVTIEGEAQIGFTIPPGGVLSVQPIVDGQPVAVGRVVRSNPSNKAIVEVFPLFWSHPLGEVQPGETITATVTYQLSDLSDNGDGGQITVDNQKLVAVTKPVR